MAEQASGNEECILVLQGGGALGAYQAGVFEVLDGAALRPHWVAGISIGAVNAALIAGNRPGEQVGRLRAFWERVSSGQGEWPWTPPFGLDPGSMGEASITGALLFGANGFFVPRMPPPWLQPRGTEGALSYYDTAPLRATLESMVDFDLINDGPTRLSLGAVNVKTGNFAYFDSARQRIDARHVMASGALPPGFPPVEIDGEWYWDGGLVSNTPLEYVLEQPDGGHRDVFQVDLFPARGELPTTLAEVDEREKDIRYSSRTRLNTTNQLDRQTIARAAERLIAKLPPELRDDPDARALAQLHTSCASLEVVHLIYRARQYETHAKDYEFSRRAMETHWQSGTADMRITLDDRRWRERKEEGMRVLDLVPPTPADQAVPAHDRRRPEMQGFRQVA
jgi:NTE family protein